MFFCYNQSFFAKTFYFWFEVYRLLSSSMNEGRLQALVQMSIKYCSDPSLSSTFQKEIHFIQTFRERKFPTCSLWRLQVKRFLAAFLNAGHQQPPFHLLSCSWTSKPGESKPLASSLGLQSRLCSTQKVRFFGSNSNVGRQLMFGSIREPTD